MATPCSVLAWRIPGTGEAGGPSVGSHRVGQDRSDSAPAQRRVYVNPKLLIYPPQPLLFGNCKAAFYICGSISLLYIISFAR